MSNPIESFIKHGLHLAVAFVVLVLIKLLVPDMVPFGMFEFWHASPNPGGLAIATTPFLLWAVAAQFLLGTAPPRWMRPGNILAAGLLVSTIAGLMEELRWRWVHFMIAAFTVQVANFVFFGFLGFGIPELLYGVLVGPLANFFTLGALDDRLLGTDWFVGAAVIVSNNNFRDGHKYQGFIGWTNSWFLGMFFFWVMFNHGLLSAIVVHFAYDAVIYAVHCAWAVQRRA